jgi:hypothetical protein
MRFVIATLLSALAASLFGTLVFLMMMALTNTNSAGDGGNSISDFLFLVGFGVAFGSIVALPTALLFGAIMVIITRKIPDLNRGPIWLLAGAISSFPAITLGNGFTNPAFIILMTCSGMIGSAVFYKIWKQGISVKTGTDPII